MAGVAKSDKEEKKKRLQDVYADILMWGDYQKDPAVLQLNTPKRMKAAQKQFTELVRSLFLFFQCHS